MSTTLLIAPPPSHPQNHSTTSTTLSAPSAPGLPDTLRARSTLSSSGPSTSSTTTSAHTKPDLPLQSTHPLERRLRAWRSTQQALHATLLRRQYGLAAPITRAMELNDCVNGEAALYLGGARGYGLSMGGGGMHGDILRGEDWEVGGWEGVYGSGGMGGDDGLGGVGVGGEFHREMEGVMGMGW